MSNMTRNNPARGWPLLLGLTLLSLGACKGQPEKAKAPAPAAAPAAPAAPAPAVTPDAAAGVTATIDPEPAKGESVVIDKEDIQVNGTPACAMTVRYAGAQDQPVTWNGERCQDITLAFVDKARLASLDRYDTLSEETRDDLARAGNGKALYIEGKATASLYPLNSAERVYEVPLAD